MDFVARRDHSAQEKNWLVTPKKLSHENEEDIYDEEF